MKKIGTFVLSSGNAVWCGSKLGWRKRLPWHDDVEAFETEAEARQLAEILVIEKRAALLRRAPDRPETYYCVEVHELVIDTKPRRPAQTLPGPNASGVGWGVPGRGEAIAEEDV